MEYQGEVYTDSLFSFYRDYFKPPEMFYNEIRAGSVIQSGETITLFGVNQSADPITESIISGEVKFKFTYASAYGETWVLEPLFSIHTKVNDAELD